MLRSRKDTIIKIGITKKACLQLYNRGDDYDFVTILYQDARRIDT